jgi:hypothetical protein
MIPVSRMGLVGLLAFAPALAADPDGEKVWKFSFGTPDAALRAGFTRVTAKDAFTSERGHGFASLEGLLAFDRGGSRIERPKDEYTASAYGAYRMTSDLTSALVEGTRDNAFQVALADGEYTAWLIAGDPAEDPPLFEAWAGGEKKLDVRIPRRTFVFMEPFPARATGGQLRIELKGPHGWLLNGLVIGKDGPALAEAVARLDRDIFFLTDEELPNWKERAAASDHHPLEWTAEERQRGYVTFPADPTEEITPTHVPERAEIGRPMTAFAARGEFEPATLCIAASKDLGPVTVELADFVAEGGGAKIPVQNASLGIVRCRPMRAVDRGGRGEYAVVPQMIEPAAGRARLVRAGAVKQWWLTVHVPPDALPGRYRMAVNVRPEKAPPCLVEWRLLVLPISLVRPAGKHWGTWLESFPPVGGLRGPERRGRNTPAELERLSRADLEDYRDHGYDLAVFNFYFDAREQPDGGFRYDLSALARTLEFWKTLGSDTPVVIGIEYTCRNFEYRFAEPGKKHVAGTFTEKAHQAILGLVRAIHDEAGRRGWPTIYFYPIDEPGNSKTENREKFAENVLDFVHEVPGCLTATTVGASDIQRLGNRVDARIYAYGSYNRNKVIEEARHGHPYWFYENGMFYAHTTLGSRNMAGFEFLRSGAEACTAWGFDATNANPDNDFDGGHKDWNVVFPGVDRLTPTIYWELCREGFDDARYVATLEQAIRLARQNGRPEDARRAEEVLAPLIDPDGPALRDPRSFARGRFRLAREILSLGGDRQLGLSFAAVTRNAAGPEKLGANVIADPSFEAGPQADGFPVATYSISDQYAKPEARPVGALVVTDEVAHSGRYSLKWDFARAEGKGSIYGRDRWLIVNVQVSREAMNGLRGKRVRVGYWFRLGGGAASPGMVLRQFGKGDLLGAISYSGGIEDVTVWNSFLAEGRLRGDYEGLDIHISCPVPADPEQAKKVVFYIDDITLAPIEEPPMAITTALDEYYAGEPIRWSVRADSATDPVRVALLAGSHQVAEQPAASGPGGRAGAFETRALEPGIYTLRATAGGSPPGAASAERQVIVAPDPFAW